MVRLSQEIGIKEYESDMDFKEFGPLSSKTQVQEVRDFWKRVDNLFIRQEENFRCVRMKRESFMRRSYIINPNNRRIESIRLVLLVHPIGYCRCYMMMNFWSEGKYEIKHIERIRDFVHILDFGMIDWFISKDARKFGILNGRFNRLGMFDLVDDRITILSKKNYNSKKKK